MSLQTRQEESYAFFQQKLPELLTDPLKSRKYAVIFNSTIEGVYDTFETAYREACIKFSADFIVQQIIDEHKIVNYLSPAVASC